MIDAAGNTTTYAYDAVGRATGRTDALGASLLWTYDDIGNQIYQRNRTDPILTNSVVWTHDPAGRILTRTANSATTTYTYDLNGNKLTAAAGGLTITATYDRLNRVLTVDDEDAGTTADTSYTYSLTSPSWTDPTGSYAATLDKFDRAVALTDPASASGWTWTYGTSGQVLSGAQGNGNTIAQTFDAAGHLLDRETKTGGTSRAAYVYAYNRAGQILSEASTVTGDPANGTVTYAYDPLGQLVGSTLSATTTAYGWDAVTNRTSVQVGGGTAATTSYDAANRPTSGANPTASYASDDDGRLIARPGQTMTWDHLGRLTAVTDAAGTATYTYDPLDRLRTVDDGGGNRIRFRYVGLTTQAAQWLDDVAGTVTRSIGNGWGGERLLDWTGTSSSRRYYGTNAHHDVTWLADSTGAVSQSLRYDPWGTPRSTVPTGYTPFRFQGSWYDATTDLSWVVTRWYAPSLGRFVSEDTLLGEPREPDSRHLYAYAAGEPVGAWDPDGRIAQIAEHVVYESSPYRWNGNEWVYSSYDRTFKSFPYTARYSWTHARQAPFCARKWGCKTQLTHQRWWSSKNPDAHVVEFAASLILQYYDGFSVTIDRVKDESGHGNDACGGGGLGYDYCMDLPDIVRPRSSGRLRKMTLKVAMKVCPYYCSNSVLPVIWERRVVYFYSLPRQP